MVCRLYKALAAFSVTGTAASWAAVALDVMVSKREKKSGVYDRMDGLDDKRAWEARTQGQEDAAFTTSGALWDGDQSGLTRPWKSQRTIELDDFGYEAPQEQTTYGNIRGHSMDIAER